MRMPGINCDHRRPGHAAFTLMEVMIAVTIFFMAMFTILGVLSSSLHAASILRNGGPTAGMVAGQISLASLTNNMEEGSDAGDFGDIPIYEGYRWVSETTEAATNGLWRVDIEVINPNGRPDSVLSILLYRPNSQSSRLGLH
ncbi:MAG: prepilin-type N-terminal cleavage/methylation domain-containing protein [Verrucomicrobiota bacterium]